MNFETETLKQIYVRPTNKRGLMYFIPVFLQHQLWFNLSILVKASRVFDAVQILCLGVSRPHWKPDTGSQNPFCLAVNIFKSLVIVCTAAPSPIVVR